MMLTTKILEVAIVTLLSYIMHKTLRGITPCD